LKNSKPIPKRPATFHDGQIALPSFRCRFLAPVTFDLNDAAPSGWEVEYLDEGASRLEFYDTYVWSLWFKKVVLCRKEGHWVLDCDGDLFEESGHPAHVKFPCEFAAGLLRDRLVDLIDPRALRKTASVRVVRQVWNFRNPEGKIVVRFTALRISATKPPRDGALMLEIQPLRGYGVEAAEMANQIESLGFVPTERRLVDEAYKLCDVQPMPYLLKPVLTTLGTGSAREAMLEVLSKMLVIARQNEAGIINDHDTEFLHDFRVCLRKMRSILGIIKGVFPGNLASNWKKSLGDICRKTNKLRDLDVHLLSRERLEQTLPPALRAGLAPFFEDLNKLRLVEAVRVSAYFRSSGYRRSMEALETTWNTPDSIPPTDEFLVPIQLAAGRRVGMRFKKISKLSRLIDELTPDAFLHEVRIECKKLRYLLDCFGHLFDSDGKALLVRQLSKLQNRLGRFNDTSVQQITLLDLAEEPIQSGKAKLTLSLGALIGSLHHEHGAMRSQVISALREFCSPENARLAESLSNKD